MLKCGGTSVGSGVSVEGRVWRLSAGVEGCLI